MPDPKIIVLANPKGGVGKSTISFNFGVFSAMNGYKTCIVDADTQQSTSLMLYEQRKRVGRDCDKLDVAHLRPGEGERELVEVVKGASDYDVVIIDTPAKDSTLVFSAIYLADLVVVPLEATFIDVESLGNVFRGLEGVREACEREGREYPELPPIFLAWNKTEARTTTTRSFMALTRDIYGETHKYSVLRSIIPDRTGSKASHLWGAAPFEDVPNEPNFGSNTPIGDRWRVFCTEVTLAAGLEISARRSRRRA